MDVSALSSATSTSENSDTALAGLNSDFDTFLTLLITQLKNQDPTNPTDTNEMTQQLVQFANVEQQIAQNKNLETLVGLQSTNANSAAVNYIGHEVQIEGDTTEVTADGTTWGYELEGVPESVTLNVLDASGALVYSEEGEIVAGIRHAFNWNLTDNSGGTVSPGAYTLRVSALDATGDPVKSTIDSTGLVSGVQSSDTGPSLLIGEDINVALAKIRKIL